MSLEKYKLPLCLIDGVQFELDDAPEVKVTVKMPINANKQFSLGWAKRLIIKNGEINASPFDVIDAQQKEFFASQIISIEGVKKPETFWSDYPLAMDEIWNKAKDALPKYEKQLEVEAKN